ncbi:MAG: hypothetical protein PWK00_08300, partial [Coxiella burnetii]|nr:hypothetical protein [Coxiella burnetii]
QEEGAENTHFQTDLIPPGALHESQGDLRISRCPQHVQKHHNLALTLMSSHFPLFILGKGQFINVFSQSEQWELIDRRH